jgi:SAM-dependent methyltransferase
LASIQEKSLAIRLTYKLRDYLSKPLYQLLAGDLGVAVDIGGGAFYKRLSASKWTQYLVVEPDPKTLTQELEKNVFAIAADGQKLPLKGSSFDTAICIQVLELIFEPYKVFQEAHRVLKTGGRFVVLVPQTGTLHGIPYHYQNLTHHWLFEAAKRSCFKVQSWQPLGGAWRTIASRLFLMFWPVFKNSYYYDPLYQKRGFMFWLTLPLQILAASLMFPIAMLLSFFDIKEESNNHLIVLSKK